MKEKDVSKDGVAQVLTRSAQDQAWKQQVMSDPSLLDQYDLTAEEKTALASNDQASLEAMGVDQRHTKIMAAKE